MKTPLFMVRTLLPKMFSLHKVSNEVNVSKLNFLHDERKGLINAIHLLCVRKWCIKILLLREMNCSCMSCENHSMLHTSHLHLLFVGVDILLGVEFINYCWLSLEHYLLNSYRNWNWCEKRCFVSYFGKWNLWGTLFLRKEKGGYWCWKARKDWELLKFHQSDVFTQRKRFCSFERVWEKPLWISEMGYVEFFW
jgi:hypothetical protein